MSTFAHFQVISGQESLDSCTHLEDFDFDAYLNLMSGEADRLSAVMPLIRKPCDSNCVFELVAALHQHKDVGIQDVLCSKLYEAKSHEIEFYLPQLCNIILNRSDKEIEPLWNFILDKCRTSLHLGLLVCFIFQGAVEDQQILAGGQLDTPALSRVRGFLNRVHAATVNSSKDREMAHIVRLFTNYQLQKERNRKRIASVSLAARNQGLANLSSHTLLPAFPAPSTTVPFHSAALSSSSSPNLATSTSSGAPSTIIAAPRAIPGRLGPKDPSGAEALVSSTYGSKAPSILMQYGGLGPSTSTPTSPVGIVPPISTGSPLDDDFGSLERSFLDVQKTIDESGMLPPGYRAAMTSQPSTPTGPPKPTPQFTLATNTDSDLLDPEVDLGRSPDSKPIDTLPDEFNEATYHSLIGQFMTPLVEADAKQYDLFTDVDMSDFDHQLEATNGIADFSNLSDLVSRLVQSLPSLDFESADQTNTSLASLNSSMLELERAYLKVAKNSPNAPPPSSTSSGSLKGASLAGAEKDPDELKRETEEFCASLDREIILKKYRLRYFRSEWNFVSALTAISSLLKHMNFKTKDQKSKALSICLQEFNAEFSRGVYLPILRRKGKTYRVMRIPYKEGIPLNSRDRVPYMLFVEVVSGDEQEEIPDLQLQPSRTHIGPASSSSSSTMGGGSGSSASLHDSDDRISMPTNSPVVSIRDSEDQKVTKSLQKLEIIDEWVVVDQSAAVVPETTQPTLMERIYKESWAQKGARIRKNSPVGHLKNWELISVVMKSGDDLRQEQLATQLIRCFSDIFKRSGLNLWVYPYEVLAVSSQGGFIETIPDAKSIHEIKEKLGADPSLRNYFNQVYGSKPAELTQAKLNFVESLAAYSLICYIMQIKDRHNGNIMLDMQGHLIHIDYGFMLTTSPGSLGFENAPFKLTVEFVEVMDGRSSSLYAYFRALFQAGFLAIRKHHSSIMAIVQMMEAGSKMACFSKGPQTMKLLEDRFKITLSEEEAIKYADDLITFSEGNWRTNGYDTYQAFTNGIKV